MDEMPNDEEQNVRRKSRTLQPFESFSPSSHSLLVQPTDQDSGQVTPHSFVPGSQKDVATKDCTNLSFDDVMCRQADLTKLLVKTHQLSLLPSREIPVFYGDPLQFELFIRVFEHSIEGKTDNSQDLLYFLEQYTGGQPRELVRSCIHMNPEKGYKEAKRLLQQFFGDAIKISNALMEKALNWSVIRAEDGKALHAYALFL